ncbi:hypothetical protein CaCOL14_003769 [Colletotrichum acutatum]
MLLVPPAGQFQARLSQAHAHHTQRLPFETLHQFRLLVTFVAAAPNRYPEHPIAISFAAFLPNSASRNQGSSIWFTTRLTPPSIHQLLALNFGFQRKLRHHSFSASPSNNLQSVCRPAWLCLSVLSRRRSVSWLSRRSPVQLATSRYSANKDRFKGYPESVPSLTRTTSATLMSRFTDLHNLRTKVRNTSTAT